MKQQKNERHKQQKQQQKIKRKKRGYQAVKTWRNVYALLRIGTYAEQKDSLTYIFIVHIEYSFKY